MKFLKYLLIFLGVFTIYGVGYYHLSPQFGERMSENDRQRYLESPNFNGSRFINDAKTFQSVDYDLSNEDNPLIRMIKGVEDGRPASNLSVVKTPVKQLLSRKNDYLMSWMGHSTILMKVEGKVLLFDPMFSDKPTPHPLIGAKRYSSELPFTIEDLPFVDAVFISHDHYDHLDLESIKKLKEKTKQFYVPLGVARHLKLWGIEDSQIVELDWWGSKKLGAIEVNLTPSQHFSGRSLVSADTLWGSWYLKAPKGNIYFSGDTGYGGHFKQIKEKLGPVDFAFLECGQYNFAWGDIHMMPEQTVQAAIDLEAKTMMPIHWGAFSLSVHKWYEPVERASKAAKEKGVPLLAPVIGEINDLHDLNFNDNKWWKK